MSNVDISRRGRCLEIRLQREAKKNALTLEMYEALCSALERFEGEQELRSALITGGEQCFTAGNDLQDFMSAPPDEGSPVMRFISWLPRLSKPLVAAVSGPAIGVGTTLLLHCDLVYADTTARFRMPFVDLGAVPEAGSSLLLPRIMGHQRAAELLLLSKKFDAEEAHQLGVVTRACPPGEALALARDACDRLGKLAPTAVRETKRLMRRGTNQNLAEIMAEEGRVFMERIRSTEAHEAIRAFFEKREPNFD
ncbi:MAG: enoyl-CoA hydratase [Polyangiaceae bacterium]|nr:enoyl-CoA hydratase [Myxococcales bacterium]MCB9585728.1 enoyl-CoA hydratase [Polyangiaceae bacterium]MCB9607343.1 enoyl-CoA hydratase [Polyangiaceae bacterium]